MNQTSNRSAAILGILLALGLLGLGIAGYQAAISMKSLNRAVTVKGLSEREVPADLVIWPIQFQLAGNDLGALAAETESVNEKIRSFLTSRNIKADEISIGMPTVTDLFANNYGNTNDIRYRYTAKGALTVYSSNVDMVRNAMRESVELGKAGIAINNEQYGSQPQFLFTGLSELKPAMVEEATRNARAVAEKFAEDSGSTLGKIKYARQGQFSIEDRDINTPHIKKVRVVSTLEYYLAD
ncbi:MAG: SIMPL domain-containing protein [Nevskiales bacterium]